MTTDLLDNLRDALVSAYPTKEVLAWEVTDKTGLTPGTLPINQADMRWPGGGRPSRWRAAGEAPRAARCGHRQRSHHQYQAAGDPRRVRDPVAQLQLQLAPLRNREPNPDEDKNRFKLTEKSMPSQTWSFKSGETKMITIGWALIAMWIEGSESLSVARIHRAGYRRVSIPSY